MATPPTWPQARKEGTSWEGMRPAYRGPLPHGGERPGPGFACSVSTPGDLPVLGEAVQKEHEGSIPLSGRDVVQSQARALGVKAGERGQRLRPAARAHASPGVRRARAHAHLQRQASGLAERGVAEAGGRRAVRAAQAAAARPAQHVGERHAGVAEGGQQRPAQHGRPQRDPQQREGAARGRQQRRDHGLGHGDGRGGLGGRGGDLTEEPGAPLGRRARRAVRGRREARGERRATTWKPRSEEPRSRGAEEPRTSGAGSSRVPGKQRGLAGPQAPGPGLGDASGRGVGAGAGPPGRRSAR